jgi:hypothetical protein
MPISLASAKLYQIINENWQNENMELCPSLIYLGM